MGKFIEVYQYGYTKPILLNVYNIVSIKESSGSNPIALLCFDNETEMRLKHSYTEVKDAIFMLSDDFPVMSAAKGDIKDEK